MTLLAAHELVGKTALDSLPAPAGQLRMRVVGVGRLPFSSGDRQTVRKETA